MERFGKIIKASLVIFMFVLAGLLFFRLFLGGYYPRSVRGLLATSVLSEAYASEEPPTAYTQELRVPYDDPNEGLFFADHMMVVPDTGSLQVTARWNESTLLRLREEYGEEFSPDGDFPFAFRIFCATEEGSVSIPSGNTVIRGEYHTPYRSKTASLAMYHYERLAFEGVDLAGVSWIRLEILREGQQVSEGDIVIYENHEEFNAFHEAKVGELVD